MYKAKRVLGLLYLTPLSTIKKKQYFSDIVAVSFIGGGNRRKPHCKSMTTLSHKVVLCTPLH